MDIVAHRNREGLGCIPAAMEDQRSQELALHGLPCEWADLAELVVVVAAAAAGVG